MAHGQRDWSNIGAEEVVHGLADMAELAARLGSVDTHNREGNIVHVETFEHGVGAWEAALYGTGADVLVSAQRYRSSGYACKLVGGSDGAAQAQIFRNFPLPVLGRYGCEFSWRPDGDVNQVYACLAWLDGTTEHQFLLRYYVPQDELWLWTTGGSAILIATGLHLDYTYAGFHTFKLVGDLVADTYVRFILNEREYDLSAYDAYTFANDDGPHIRIAVAVFSIAGHNGFIYVDDIILTQNEPA